MGTYRINKVTNAFWKELGKIEKLTGVRREAIALSLARLNSEKGKEWEASLWEHSYPKENLESWIQEKLEQAQYSEDAFLELSRLLPEWARRSLIKIAEKLPAGHGGKPPALRFEERMRVLRRFQELTQNPDSQKRISNDEAYKKIARELERKGRKVHPNTVRNICAGERHRIAFISPADSERTGHL